MIEILGISYKKIKFPCGEISISLKSSDWDIGSVKRDIHIKWSFENISEIFELKLLVDTIRINWGIIKVLDIPYMPFSREDRQEKNGSFSLKTFSNILNSMNIRWIRTIDPHSDVCQALINNLEIVSQSSVFSNKLAKKKDFYLISPDGGALKKIYALASLVDCISVIECSKNRNVKTGEITGTTVHIDDLNGKDCYIVDDICDGGRTFIEIAKVLKKKNAGKIILMVTHGFFTKGTKVFDGFIDEIYCETKKGYMDFSKDDLYNILSKSIKRSV